MLVTAAEEGTRKAKKTRFPKFRLLSFLTSLDFFRLFDLWQDESYDLQDRKAFAKFLIDADIRLVSWNSNSTGLLSVSSVSFWWCHVAETSCEGVV